MFDTFCILSLTYRSDGFITMLAPLRDHLRPKDPPSSLLLCPTKEHYFSRLSTYVYPGKPGFEESSWITSEDVNIEHLLDVFTSIDAGSKDVWDACASFMNHIRWHKPRLVILGPKIEALPDDHPSKARCLNELSRLLNSVGNLVESKRLFTHALKLWRECGDDYQVAYILSELSDTNRLMGLYEEGIQRAKEASEIFEQLGNTAKQAECLIYLAYLLHDDKQLDAAEEAASHAIDLLPEKGEQFLVCKGHRVLGNIYRSKGDTEKAIHHFEVALKVASSLKMVHQLFWAHYALAQLFFGKRRFDDAHAHIERAKSHAINDAYILGRAIQLQAILWYYQRMLSKAKIEALHAADIYEKLGATQDLDKCRELLRWIDEEMKSSAVSDESGVNGEPLEMLPLPACIDVPFQGRETE